MLHFANKPGDQMPLGRTTVMLRCCSIWWAVFSTLASRIRLAAAPLSGTASAGCPLYAMPKVGRCGHRNIFPRPTEDGSGNSVNGLCLYSKLQFCTPLVPCGESCADALINAMPEAFSKVISPSFHDQKCGRSEAAVFCLSISLCHGRFQHLRYLQADRLETPGAEAAPDRCHLPRGQQHPHQRGPGAPQALSLAFLSS